MIHQIFKKFGALIEHKMLYKMTPGSLQSDVDFRVKYKVKLRTINDLKVDLESNVELQ